MFQVKIISPFRTLFSVVSNPYEFHTGNDGRVRLRDQLIEIVFFRKKLLKSALDISRVRYLP